MDSGVHRLGAVAWTNAWNSAAPEASLRMAVEPSRLLELLRGLPVARALLTDLQQAMAAGRTVELIVSPDRQIAEIATGSGHYLLAAVARNSVLAALLGRPAAATAAGAPAPPERPGAAQAASAGSRNAQPSGVLWQSPTLAQRAHPPAEAIALPWLGAEARLQVWRDGGGGRPDSEPESGVHHATLHLQLRELGRFDADIRLCGNTVAVSVDCSRKDRVGPQLPALQQRLAARGLTAAHVGLSTDGGAP